MANVAKIDDDDDDYGNDGSGKRSLQEIFHDMLATEDTANYYGQTAMHTACIKGHLAVCRMLCRKAQSSMLSSMGSAYAFAAMSSTTTTVAPEVSMLDKVDCLGCTPLHYCTLLPNKKQGELLAKALLGNNCNPNIVDCDGYTPLALAVHCNNIELTSVLVAFGANPNMQSPEDGFSPLMLAAYHGFLKIACGLLNPLMLPSITEHVQRTTPPQGASPSQQNKLGATALIIAAQKGDKLLVAEMLATSQPMQMTMNMRDIEGRTALASATFRGHSKVVAVLLERRANTNIADKQGATPLMLAVLKKHKDIVDMLLDARADVSSKDEEGFTALMVATQMNDVEVASRLIETAGALTRKFSIDYVNSSSKDGSTALMLAAANGNEQMIQLLLRSRAGLDASRPIDDWSAMFHVVYSSKLKALRALVTKQSAVANTPPGSLVNKVLAELNRRSSEVKLTPLLLACLEGNSSVVKLLLDKGSAAHSHDCSFFTPLMAAAQNGDEKMTQLLLNKGSRIDYYDYDGYTALMIAAALGFPRVVDLLLSNGANADQQQVNGRTAIMLAASEKQLDAFTTLLRHNVDVTAVDVLGRSVLHYVMLSGCEPMVTALVSMASMDVNVVDKNGMTPLMYAACNSSEFQELFVTSNGQQQQADSEVDHVIALLKAKGISVDLRDFEDETALIKAYRAKNWPVAEQLLKAGASAVLATSDGMTPLIYAAIDNEPKGIELIKQFAPTTINVVDLQNRSALLHAVVRDHFEAVDVLLSQPAVADINMFAHIPGNLTPQQLAAINNDPDAWYLGMPLLHIAATCGTEPVARRLLEAGVDVSQVNARRETALMLACSGANWSVVELLLQFGATVESRDSAGQPVLHRLCYFGDEEEASRGFQLLITHRGQSILDTVVDSPGGNTVLHWAVICDLPEVVNELIILGANKNIRNNEGKTPDECVVYGPKLFEDLGLIIGDRWRDLAESIVAPSSGEPMLATDELDEIFRMQTPGTPNFHEKCATAWIEQFYELNDSRSDLDVDRLAEAWSSATGTLQPERMSQMLLDAKGRTVIFRSDTLEMLAKNPSRMPQSFKMLPRRSKSVTFERRKSTFSRAPSRSSSTRASKRSLP